MLSRNDMTVQMQQLDVGRALDLLTMFKVGTWGSDYRHFVRGK